jgi:hypothetical protein
VRRLIFLHMPRTGGTALHDALAPAFAPEETCPARFAELYRFGPEELARWRFFSGHFRMDEVRRIPGERVIVTILRDPRERILSLHRFWHRIGLSTPEPTPELRAAREESLLGFLRSPVPEVREAIDNALTRTLAGHVLCRARGWRLITGPGRSLSISRAETMARALEGLMQVDLLGFTEALEVVAARLRRVWPELPAPPRLGRRNAWDGPRADLVPPRPPPPLTPEVEAELDRLTECDRFLVARARELPFAGSACARPALRRCPPGDGW